jgi:hypothetical protein
MGQEVLTPERRRSLTSHHDVRAHTKRARNTRSIKLDATFGSDRTPLKGTKLWLRNGR